jgi:hypothetical protein
MLESHSSTAMMVLMEANQRIRELRCHVEEQMAEDHKESSQVAQGMCMGFSLASIAISEMIRGLSEPEANPDQQVFSW